jgi:hypothetical protein
MELIEIKGLFEMDSGSPLPIILSNDNELFISFYAERNGGFDEPHQRNSIYDTGIVVLKFKSFLKYSFGLPSNETIQGHPYFKLGLNSFSFYELKSSDLIYSLQKIEKVHPYFNPEKWKEYKHYILTFHDNMFECVAKEFEIAEENTSIYHQVGIMLNEISQKDF